MAPVVSEVSRNGQVHSIQAVNYGLERHNRDTLMSSQSDPLDFRTQAWTLDSTWKLLFY